MAHIALHFRCSPLELDDEQILDHLHILKTQFKTPSEAFFKHTVYGLRYLFRLYGREESRIKLPLIKGSKKLPVVLSPNEVKVLLKSPTLLKHRLIIGLLYGCGLRCFELQNVKIRDVDFDRKVLHVTNGKGGKQRYLPLCDVLLQGIIKYLNVENPVEWLFSGNNRNGDHVPLTPRGIQYVVKQAREKSGILKHITTHVLRHTYATHLLEMGLDIMSVKDLLGHADIQTTLIYLHVAKVSRLETFSPLEKLYPTKS